MCSLKGHVGEVRQFLQDHPGYHLFGVAESWLGPSVADHLVEIDGYTLVRQDRNVDGGSYPLRARCV